MKIVGYSMIYAIPLGLFVCEVLQSGWKRAVLINLGVLALLGYFALAAYFIMRPRSNPAAPGGGK